MAMQEFRVEVHYSVREYRTAVVLVEVEHQHEIDTTMLEQRLDLGYSEDAELQVDDYEVIDTSEDPAFADDAFTEHAREVARGDLDA